MRYGDNSGSAARFFYIAKPSQAERNIGCFGLPKKKYSHDGREKDIENPYQRNNSVASNFHPTVKPVTLMRHLIRMITPPGGTVLDPFAGSGTTGLAADKERVNCILMEFTPEYCEIIKARNNEVRRQQSLF